MSVSCVCPGGSEIGQGLYTKVAQSVAYKLGIPITSINVTPTRSDSTPSLTYTGGSMTSELAVLAAMAACDTLNTRLAPLKTANPSVRLVAVPVAQITLHAMLM